jgi:hypothetical protein
VGLERDPLRLVRITEEILEWKCNDSGSRKQRLTAVGISFIERKKKGPGNAHPALCRTSLKISYFITAISLPFLIYLNINLRVNSYYSVHLLISLSLHIYFK